MEIPKNRERYVSRNFWLTFTYKTRGKREKNVRLKCKNEKKMKERKYWNVRFDFWMFHLANGTHVGRRRVTKNGYCRPLTTRARLLSIRHSSSNECNIASRTRHVFHIATRIILRVNCSLAIAKCWLDLDNPKDLPVLYEFLKGIGITFMHVNISL